MLGQIVFVEDDSVIRDNYSEVLIDHGFEVEGFADRKSALLHLQSHTPNLILLDVGLGSEHDGGFQLCQEIRRFNRTVPIVFLTSHDAEIDKISGIRLGADDYLLKDVSLDYLVVKIEALLRRFGAINGDADGDPDLLVRGNLGVNLSSEFVTWKERPVNLSMSQFKMLVELIVKPGHVKSSFKLMAAANIVVESNTVSAHIKSIRKEFKLVDDDFDCIKSAYGHGYRWLE